MLWLPLGANVNPCIKHCPFTHLKGERIRFIFGKIGGSESIVHGTGLRDREAPTSIKSIVYREAE